MNQPQREQVWPAEILMRRSDARNAFEETQGRTEQAERIGLDLERYVPASQLDALREALRSLLGGVEDSPEYTWAEIEDWAKPELMGDGEWASTFVDLPVDTAHLLKARALLTQLEERKQ